MNNPNLIIAELIGLTEKKVQLFKEIEKITMEQQKDIEVNEADNLEQLVQRKQTIIDNVDLLDRSFQEKFDLLKNQLRISNLDELEYEKYPNVKNLKLKVEEIMTMAQNIMRIEEANREGLAQLMKRLKGEMKQLNLGKKSIKAYEAPVINNDGIYIDRKK